MRQPQVASSFTWY